MLAAMTTPARAVSASLEVRVLAACELELQLAVARLPGLAVDETLEITLDGVTVLAEEIAAEHGGRIHRIQVGEGALRIGYRARVEGQADEPVPDPLERSRYLRPSRYAESDKFFGFVGGQFDLARPVPELVVQAADFVAARLSYMPGSSQPTDAATDTLLAGAGVCRDYAHLVVALLRAMHIPARLAAVYAPGCDPMDFHAVAEALVDGRWVALDATRLAPRQTLVRIATGRDAADTAFLDNHGGAIALDATTVTAIVEGELPVDDPALLVAIR